jgi:proline racemase
MPPSVVAGAAVAVRWGQQLVRADLVQCADGLHAIVDAESAGIGFITLDRRLVVGLASAVSRHLVATRTGAPLAQVLLTGPAGDEADLRVVPVTPGGRVRRSPSASGSAAVVTVLEAMGFVPADRPVVLQGPSGETFEARVTARADEGAAHPVLHVDVTGQAWIVGEAALIVDDRDPLGDGFVI